MTAHGTPPASPPKLPVPASANLLCRRGQILPANLPTSDGRLGSRPCAGHRVLGPSLKAVGGVCIGTQQNTNDCERCQRPTAISCPNFYTHYISTSKLPGAHSNKMRRHTVWLPLDFPTWEIPCPSCSTAQPTYIPLAVLQLAVPVRFGALKKLPIATSRSIAAVVQWFKYCEYSATGVSAAALALDLSSTS